MIKTLGLVIKDSKEALDLAREVRDYVKEKGINVIIEEACAQELNAKGEPVETMDVEMIATLGGDGTILRALNTTRKNIPIFGINLGAEGYLARVKPAEWKAAIDKVASGDVKIDERVRIDVVVDDEIVGSAINEAVVGPSEPVKMLNFEVFVDGCHYFSSRADGIIVATPIGSTAYSLSAGGSIIELRVPAFIVTPICPFDREARPVVVPQTAEITVKVIKTRREAIVIFDGEYKINIEKNKEVLFRLSDKMARFVDI